MAASTPLLESSSAQSAFDESAFDESATREPVEVLIKEARRRARRRRLVIGAVSAATIAVAAIAVTASFDDAGPTERHDTALDSAARSTDFGVFEPMRGRIVYVAGDELRAVDPADPTSVHTVALPDDLAAGMLMAAGWSADGTRLALTSEHAGKSYVMDADGTITQTPGDLGCCAFVTDPWLSPDGTTAVERVTADQLRLRHLEGGDTTRVIELAPPLGDLEGLDLPFSWVPTHAWSPDGSRIALALYRQVGTHELPSVYVVDLDTGAARELVRAEFGHIRQMTWSLNSSRLLVVAGPWRFPTTPPPGNPLLHPHEAGLYQVDVDPSARAVWASTPLPIASGHYVAATWSADGSQIAAMDFTPSGRRLVVMGADGSASRVLLDLRWDSNFTGLAWHPIPSRR